MLASFIIVSGMIGLAVLWSLALVVLPGLAIWWGWQRRWWRALIALAVFAAMLGWGAGLPAWQKYRMQMALNAGPYQAGALPDLRGSEVVLLGTVDSRRWDSECVPLIKVIGVTHVWQAGMREVPAPPERLPIRGELLPPGSGGVMECKHQPVADSTAPQAEWAVLLPDRRRPDFIGQPDWSQLYAHFGDHIPQGLQPDYMLIRMGADGSVDINDTVLAGFHGSVVSRPWWYSPFLPQISEVLYPQPDPGRAAFNRMICGDDGGCDV